TRGTLPAFHTYIRFRQLADRSLARLTARYPGVVAELAEEEPPTVAETPARRRASDSQLPPVTRGTPAPASTSGVASTSAREADAAAFAHTLRQAEIARTRRIVPFLLLLALAAAVLVPIAGGDPIAIELVYIGIGCAVVAIVALYWLTSDAERYLESRV